MYIAGAPMAAGYTPRSESPLSFCISGLSFCT